MESKSREWLLRDEFEAWAKNQRLGLAYGDCGYVFSSTEMAWRAWQASRSALVVEMLEPFKMAKSSSGLTYYYEDEVDNALRAAGITVKGEGDE